MKRVSYFFIVMLISLQFGCNETTVSPLQNKKEILSKPVVPHYFYVYTYTELEQAINNSINGDFIIIQSNIDFEHHTLNVNKSITIKSSSKKKLFDSHSYTTQTPLIRVTSNNVCFDNLTIQGNINSYQNLGISSNGNTGLIVKNCDISNFRYAGISLGNNSQANIISNYIHHQPATDGLSYGVVLGSGAYATIKSNIFEFNRHDIAGTGAPNTGYEASYNTSSNTVRNPNGSSSHAFDMHGEAQNCSVLANDHTAGKTIIIHHNTFNDGTQYAIDIRGVPDDYCKIYDNTFAHSYILGNCFKQEIEGNRQANGCGSVPNENEAYGNIYISHNNFNGPTPTISTFQAKYNGNWNRLISTSYPVSNIAFGDFNGDGITDIFFPYPNEWKISISALIGSRHLNYSSVPLSDLGFGDFNGDGITDVVSTWSNKWWISYSGSAGWTYLNSSSFTIHQLYVDDVNSDGKSDIVAKHGCCTWKYSSGGTSGWINCPSGYTPPTIDRLNHRRTLHDFNGDGVNDSYRIQ